MIRSSRPAIFDGVIFRVDHFGNVHVGDVHESRSINTGPMAVILCVPSALQCGGLRHNGLVVGQTSAWSADLQGFVEVPFGWRHPPSSPLHIRRQVLRSWLARTDHCGPATAAQSRLGCGRYSRPSYQATSRQPPRSGRFAPRALRFGESRTHPGCSPERSVAQG
jgi:hypothetical protein